MEEDLTMAELNDAIRKLKMKKAPGKDRVYNEMITHLGTTAKENYLSSSTCHGKLECSQQHGKRQQLYQS